MRTVPRASPLLYCVVTPRAALIGCCFSFFERSSGEQTRWRKGEGERHSRRSLVKVCGSVDDGTLKRGRWSHQRVDKIDVSAGCGATAREEVAGHRTATAPEGGRRRAAWAPPCGVPLRVLTTLVLLATACLDGARGATTYSGPRYFDQSEVVTFRDEITNGERRTVGTPADGTVFESPCTITGDGPDCSIEETLRWGEQIVCSPGAYCFVVATEGASDIVFTTSPALTEHMNLRTLKASIKNIPVMPGAVHKIRLYEISEIQGFPEFESATDLQVCFDTVPAGAGKRCVSFYFGVPPFQVQLSVDGGNFSSTAVARIMPYQRSRVTVRVRDLNAQDRVCIDHPATYNKISGVPGLMEDQGSTAFFQWEDVGECYAATRCVSGLVDGQTCRGRLWERIFFIKAKPYNATLTFGAVPDASRTNVRSKRRGTDLDQEDRSTQTATLSLHTVLGVPAFLDTMPGVNTVPGTPYSGKRFPSAFVNCPVPKIAIYSVLQRWSSDTQSDQLGYLGSESVEIVEGQMPEGVVINRPEPYEMPRFTQRNAKDGNYHLQGSIASVEIDWTPRKGQEGQDHWMCLTAKGGQSHNTRCFVLPVSRCQYCTIEGDSLQSLAVDFKTSWLQLYTANSASVEAFDDQNKAKDYPLNPAHLVAGTRVTLGPLYHVKAHDSMDALATRFHTSVERLMEVNPDLKTPALQVGQELCVIPDVCPKENR